MMFFYCVSTKCKYQNHLWFQCHKEVKLFRLSHLHFGSTWFPSHKSITCKHSQGHQLDQAQDSSHFSGTTVPRCLMSSVFKTIFSNTMYVYFACLCLVMVVHLFCFLDFTCKWTHRVFFFLWLMTLTSYLLDLSRLLQMARFHSLTPMAEWYSTVYVYFLFVICPFPFAPTVSSVSVW